MGNDFQVLEERTSDLEPVRTIDVQSIVHNAVAFAGFHRTSTELHNMIGNKASLNQIACGTAENNVPNAMS